MLKIKKVLVKCYHENKGNVPRTSEKIGLFRYTKDGRILTLILI